MCVRMCVRVRVRACVRVRTIVCAVTPGLVADACHDPTLHDDGCDDVGVLFAKGNEPVHLHRQCTDSAEE